MKHRTGRLKRLRKVEKTDVDECRNGLLVEYASLKMCYSAEKDSNLNVSDVISTCQSCQGCDKSGAIT